jgi:hypothetical protein
VDRLDYTKGIPRRMLAFERLLENHPELRGRIRLLQIAVPSREGVKAYRQFREETDTLIGRIHGAFATPSWVPIHHLHHSVSPRELVTLYRAADVMLVTPLRDGMNLVAKEFVASRTDEDGVLVLSEFAGAASEMAEAIHVNPYDIDGTAEAYYRALTMPLAERRARMRSPRTTSTSGSGASSPRSRTFPREGRRPLPRRSRCSRRPWNARARRRTSCCCSTTTERSWASPRRPTWPRRIPTSSRCSARWRQDRAPTCT